MLPSPNGPLVSTHHPRGLPVLQKHNHSTFTSWKKTFVVVVVVVLVVVVLVVVVVVVVEYSSSSSNRIYIAK